MYISPSEPDAALKHPAFKFQATLERKKLFVKGTGIFGIFYETKGDNSVLFLFRTANNSYKRGG